MFIILSTWSNQFLSSNEYSQVFNPWLSMSVLLLHRYPDVPRGCSLWSSSLKEPAVFSLLLKQYTLRSLEYIWRIGFR